MMRLQEVHTVELPGATTCYSGCRTGTWALGSSNNTVVSQLASESHSIIVECSKPVDDAKCRVKQQNECHGGEFRTYAERLAKICISSESSSSSSQHANQISDSYCQAHDVFYPRRRISQGNKAAAAQFCYQVFSLQQRNRAVAAAAAGENIFFGKDDNQEKDGTTATTPKNKATGILVIRKVTHETLLTRNHKSSSKQHNINDELLKVNHHQILSIQCQPLLLHISELNFEDGQHLIAIFVGISAEPYLKMYIENNTTHQFEESSIGSADTEQQRNNRNIVPDDLCSPTMSLSSVYDERAKLHYLAIGAQNGTVTVVVFQLGILLNSLSSSGQVRFSMHSLFIERKYVDGPLLTLHLHLDVSAVMLGRYFIDLVIGSLCAFVCMYRKTVHIRNHPVVATTTTTTTIIKVETEEEEGFKGPSVVVEGLFSERLKVEDSVLSVHKFSYASKSGAITAVGTYSGRLLLFDADEQITDKSTTTAAEMKDSLDEAADMRRLSCYPSTTYHKLICSQDFNSPIHGIAFGDLDGDGLPELLVTSLKRIHILRFHTVDLASIVHQRIQDIVALRAAAAATALTEDDDDFMD